MENIIEELIPHRDPFLFVDEIISATAEEITGVKTFSADHSWLKGSFPGSDFIPGTILIESMAQCGGAGIKLLDITDGLFGLASIEKAEFLAAARYDVPVTFVVKNIRVSNKLIKQSGIAYVNETPVLEATWLCVKFSQ